MKQKYVMVLCSASAEGRHCGSTQETCCIHADQGPAGCRALHQRHPWIQLRVAQRPSVRIDDPRISKTSALLVVLAGRAQDRWTWKPEIVEARAVLGQPRPALGSSVCQLRARQHGQERLSDAQSGACDLVHAACALSRIEGTFPIPVWVSICLCVVTCSLDMTPG